MVENKPENEVMAESNENEAPESAPSASMDDAEELSVEQLQAAYQKAQSQVQSHWERLLRKEAELQNIKKRASTEVDNVRKFALESFASELLEVVDSLEKGLEVDLAQDSPAHSMLEGLQLTHKNLLKVLKKFGVEPLSPEEKPFDPQYHEAISMQVTSELPPNHVMMVIQKGYLLQSRLLRPARVIVSREDTSKKEESDSPQANDKA